MSFDLTSLFSRQSQIQTPGQPSAGQTDAGQATGNAGAAGNVRAAGRAASTASTEGLHLTAGSTISGQVVSVSGDVVQIEVAPGTVLSARVEEGILFSKGMTASFEVSSVSDSQIALRALFQNTAANMATITKAIDAAGLPQTADTVSMVNAMMEDGMPIDKAALQDMYRQIVANPTVSGEKIIAMNRLQIPVTEENIQQFEAYLNLEHQISSGVETIADSMADTLMNLISEGKTAEAADLIKQMMGALGQLSPEENQQMPAGGNGPSLKDGVVLLKTDLNMPAADMAAVTDVVEETAVQREENLSGAVVSQEAPADAKSGPVVTVSLEELMRAVRIFDETATNTPELLADLEKAGISGEKAQQFVNGELTGKELLDFTRDLLLKISRNPESLTGNLKEFFQDLSGQKSFQQAFRTELFQQWLMKPEDVADKQKIADFYTRLSEQTGKLMDSLQNLSAADKTLFSQVSNIHNNIEFMNQLNQTMSYVQLPLKLAGENAHGDLYVYTNKKGLAREDGNVSAFLHLDMEHLGPVDVYVAMQNQKVSTQFYLKDDEMLDFIGEHIHMLNERLEKKGYQMSIQMSVKEKPGNVMEEILEDRKENIRIGEYSFDMRA